MQAAVPLTKIGPGGPGGAAVGGGAVGGPAVGGPGVARVVGVTTLALMQAKLTVL